MFEKNSEFNSSQIDQMAWHQDPDQSGSKPPMGAKKPKPSGPPNLDEVYTQIKKQVQTFLGRKDQSGSGGNGSDMNGAGPSGRQQLFGWGIGIFFLIAVYLMFGFYKVNPPEKAVVTRFGAFNRIEGSGLHWLMPLVEVRKIVNVQEISNFTQGSLMLTQDVNIIDFNINVQYRIRDPKAYLFNDAVPLESLKEASESTLRQMVGHLALHDALLIDQRFSETLPENITQTVLDETNIAKSIQAILDSYQCGIEVKEVAIKQPRVPEEVRAAYEDVIKALENLETEKNNARAYANQISAEVEGQVKRILEEAHAYQQERILAAEGEIARFNLLLPEYQKSPDITKKRLYLETLEKVYQNNQKVLVDLKGSEVVVLPLDQMLANRTPKNTESDSEAVPPETIQKPKITLSSADSKNIQNTQKNGLDVVSNYRQQQSVRARYPVGSSND